MMARVLKGPKFILFLGLLITACTQDRSSAQRPVAVIGEEVAKKLASNIESGKSRFFIDGTVRETDSRNPKIQIFDDQLAGLIAKALEGKEANTGNNKFVLAKNKDDANLIIENIRLSRAEETGEVSVEADYKPVSPSGSPYDPVPITVELKELGDNYPLVESAITLEGSPPPRINALPETIASAPEGGFGVEILKNGEPTSMRTDPFIPVSVVNTMKEDDVFQLQLYNDYDFDAVAFIGFNGNQPLMKDGEDVPVLVPRNGKTLVEGWINSLAKGHAFKLQESTDEEVLQHLEVRFNFASKDIEELKSIGGQSVERGLVVGRGDEISISVKLEKYHVHLYTAEIVKVLFEPTP